MPDTPRPGDVYHSCDPRGGPSIRIESIDHTGRYAHIVDAATGKRRRRILLTALHDSPTTHTGRPRRTGYAFEERP
ncbi:hypothetical protein [Streptomyces aidingensis]|uniref:Uncharacterized protein n=1 Tax=Streptomyces aidingensis TaxID=910347 RepID=A0A1I1Q5U5_9ACTN|nr:hypothetical protein [Streptomyces aidingensis]SFD13500.1 hypothetical protein SAMN05421773_11062 [Streptomyces aidingensis]